MVPQFGATVVQSVTRVVTDAASRDRVIAENLERDCELIDYVCGEPRYKSKLVVFPEFFLTGVPESRNHDEYLMRSMTLPGDEIEPLRAKARQYGVYIAANCFEIDPDWPGRCFNTTFVLDPAGEIALKYRKLNDTQTFMPTNTNPGDVLTEYVERYGEDALFPTLDTPLGRIGAMTCYDCNFPEVGRIYGQLGAEIMVVPTGEGYTFNRYQEMMRLSRAYENSYYVLCANQGKFLGGTRPEGQQRGRSQIIDFDGDMMEVADGPGELTLTAILDINALRQKRARVDFYNFNVGLRASLYARFYSKMSAWEADHWADAPMRSNEEAVEYAKQILERHYAEGRYQRPDLGTPETAPVPRLKRAN